MDEPLQTFTCPYCGIKHTPPRYWKEYAYCSKAHRVACVEKHVVFEERNCEFNPEVHGATQDLGRFYDLLDRVKPEEASPVFGLNAEQVDKLKAFFVSWLTLNPTERDIVAMRLTGEETFAEIGKRRGTSAQSAHKSVTTALHKVPALQVALYQGTPANMEKKREALLLSKERMEKDTKARAKAWTEKRRDIAAQAAASGGKRPPTPRAIGSPSPYKPRTGPTSSLLPA
jgi:hypothetical protein